MLEKVIYRTIFILIVLLTVSGILYITFEPPPSEPSIFPRIVEKVSQGIETFSKIDELKSFLEKRGVSKDLLVLIPRKIEIDGYELKGGAPLFYGRYRGSLLFFEGDRDNFIVAIFESEAPYFPKNAREVELDSRKFYVFDIDDYTFVLCIYEGAVVSILSTTMTVRSMQRILRNFLSNFPSTY